MYLRTTGNLCKSILLVVSTLSITIGQDEIAHSNTNNTYFTVASYLEVPMGGGQLIDFDSDGDLDYVGIIEIGSWLQMLKAARNDGLGNFTDATVDVFGADTVKMIHPSAFLVADYNGDSRDDVFVGDMGIDAPPFGGAQNRIFIQDGAGMLIDETETRLPVFLGFTHAAALGDFDNDGDMDVFAKDSPGQISSTGHTGFYVNNGDGYFEYDTTRTPIEIVEHDLFWAYSIADIDNDGDMDLFAGAAKGPPLHAQGFDYFEERDVAVLNDGQGYFSYAPVELFPINDPPDYFSISQPQIIAADLNSDGWVDFLQEMSPKERLEPAPGKIKLLINNSDGTFRNGDSKLPFFESLGAPLVADFNNDGYIDIIAGASLELGGMVLFMNRANADFIDASSIFPPVPAHPWAGIHVGDIDNDGDIDILATDNHNSGLIFIRNEMPFDVLANYPLSAPSLTVLLSPADGIEITTEIILAWEYVDKATEYNLQVASDANFATTIIDTSGLVMPTYVFSESETGLTNYWRVAASNAGGTSDWTAAWSFTKVLLAAFEQSTILPDNYALHQNYPNPFNPVTTIQYDLPQSSNAAIVVYDISGRQVAELSNAYMASGNHQVQWDGRGFPSGIYIARLVTPGVTKSIKMVILK